MSSTGRSSLTAKRGARTALLALTVAAVSLSGCGRTLNDDDCRAVADHLREVWQSEAKASAPQDGTGAERAAAVIKSEGEKLVADWSNECKKELLGRRVDAKEFSCLLAAKTLAEINKCSEL